MTPSRKLIVVAAMFALAAALVFLASATDGTAPLFAMFLPLLVVPWALTRPVPGEVMPPIAGRTRYRDDEPADETTDEPDA